MEQLNNLLCKAGNIVFAAANFAGNVVGAIVKWTILYALAFAAMVSAALLWLSVPYFACTTLFSEINSQWQVYAMFGIFGAWAFLTKVLFDRLKKRG